MPSVGNVTEISKELVWRIPYFLSLTAEDNEQHYSSFAFLFANETWYFSIFPNHERINKSDGYIGIYLSRKYHGPSVSLEYSISLKTLEGKKDKQACYTHTFKEKDVGFGASHCILRSELLERKSELLPYDVLTVLCTLKYSESIGVKSDIATAKCSHCKETVEADISSHEKKCVNKPIRCPDCGDVIILLNWHEHECQTTKQKGVVSLSEDFKNMLLSGKNHDLILKIGDKELRAHQDILIARSRVFKSMLNHNMKEKNSGVIEVPDCNPCAMELFLSYVYTGKVETLDQSNMFGLYYIADKYDMQNLKEDCCDFIKKSLSHTNFCDIIQLAVNHSDIGLIGCATEYFTNNALDIMVTVEWQSFLKDNCTLGNELLIKSFQKVKNINISK